MDIEILCNTDDEQVFANVAANSRSHASWVKREEANEGHAVIVGGGPSVVDYLPSLRKRIALGQTVFALNGACGFLNRHGIMPDYQVILDARPQNVNLIADAKAHLIASQVDPLVLHELPKATLWHPAVPGIDEHLPEHDGEFALIGGGTTVGLSSMMLAYTLGFRKLHLYGYDSSHKDGKGHAYPQPQNLADQVVKVTANGQSFRASLAMIRQAELFPEACNSLIALGCTITVESDGLIRAAMAEAYRQAEPVEPLPEDEKYRRMWSLDAYRAHSPGEREAETFVKAAAIREDTHVIDFGCGSGKGAAQIHALTGCPVTMVDFADNAVDAGNSLPFVVKDLTKPMGLCGDVGYCTDVMEHIPPDDVREVIDNIMACVDRCWFKIALFHDNMGALIGQPLHLSVFPAEWWEKVFYGYRILHQAIDPGEFAYATFHVQRLNERA